MSPPENEGRPGVTTEAAQQSADPTTDRIQHINGAGLSGAHTNTGRLQRALLERLKIHEGEDTIPTNGRFLFYELEQRGVVTKDAPPGQKRTPRQDLTDALTRLRELGLVPWEWIIDERRDYTAFATAPSVAEYVADSVQYASLDRWPGKPPPLIICESEGVYGVLYNLAARYACPITFTSGQVRAHLINEVAPRLQVDQQVMYLGHADLSGGQIEDHTQRAPDQHAPLWAMSLCQSQRRVSRSRRRTGTPHATLWERLALTQAQVDADERLQRLVIVKTDKRYRPARQFEAVELETIGQRQLVEMEQQRAEVAEQLWRLRP